MRKEKREKKRGRGTRGHEEKGETYKTPQM
jgi:hypothetical protein